MLGIRTSREGQNATPILLSHKILAYTFLFVGLPQKHFKIDDLFNCRKMRSTSLFPSFLVRIKNSSAVFFNEKVLIGLWGVLDFPCNNQFNVESAFKTDVCLF